MFTKEDIANRKAEAEASLEGLLQSRRELDRKIGLHKNRTEELRAGLEMAEKEEKIIGKKLHGCTVIGVVSLATLSASAVIDRWQIPFFIGTAFVIACIILVYRLWKQRKQKACFKNNISGQLLEVTAEIENCYEELTVLLPETEQKKVWLEQTEGQLKQCEIAEERYAELKQRQRELEREAAAIALAADTLEELSGQLYEEFEANFGIRLSDYAKAFTDHAYETLLADDDLNLRALTKDRSVGISEVSFGTAEQFYMALRFAAADVFDPEKKNPIILDDSFSAFDEQRLESAILALSKCGRQVLLLSSTGREETVAKRMGITYEAVF